MSDLDTFTIVVGNDVVLSNPLSLDRGSKVMADFDLPPIVAQKLLADSMTRHERSMQQIEGDVGVAHNIARFSALRRFDETGVAEGKTKAGILATDVGGPTNAGGAANQ